MAVVSTPSLSLRDFLQRILPTVIAVCLFVPFFPGLAARMTLEGLIVGAVILSYIAAEPLYTEVLWPITRRLPFVGRELKKRERRRAWLAANWDLRRLLFSAGKDNSDALYVNYGYVEFYHRVGSLLLVYGVANLIWLALGVAYWPAPGDPVWERALRVTTPMLGRWQLSTPLLSALALLFSYTSFRQFLGVYEEFFLPRGQFDMLAQLKHEDDGDLALSIWGSVRRGGEAAPEVEVRLLDAGDAVLSRCVTNEDGDFQFRGWYRRDPEARLKLLAVTPEWHAEREAILSKQGVPRFDIEA